MDRTRGFAWVASSWSDRVCWFLVQRFQRWVPLFGRKDVSLPPGTGRVFAHGDLFTAFTGNRRRAEYAFCNSCFSSVLNSEQSLCYSGVFWGELPCTPPGAQITWPLPVLIQGADARPERGCLPAHPVASGPFLGSSALFFPGRRLSRMLLSGEELGSLSSHPFPPQTQRP